MNILKNFTHLTGMTAAFAAGMMLIAAPNVTLAGNTPKVGTSTIEKTSVVRDHRRKPGDPPAPATTPDTTYHPRSTVRDHRPGGNADPCWKNNNTCSRGDLINSNIAKYQKNPQTASYCEPSRGPGCYQGYKIPDGSGGTKIIYLAFEKLHGPLRPGQLDLLMSELQKAKNQTLGGGNINTKSPNTARQQF